MLTVAIATTIGFENANLAAQEGRLPPVQDPVLTPLVSYEFGVPLALDRTPGEVEWCATCEGSGTSYNHTVRLGVAFNLPTILPGTTKTIGRITLGLSGGTFTSDAYQTPLVNPTTNEATITEQRFLVSSLTASIAAEGLIRIPAGWGSAVTFGPWAEYRLIDRFVHSEEILAPEEMVFFDNRERRRLLNEGEILGSSPATGGLLAGVQRSIDISRSLAIDPELFFRADLPSLANGLGFRSVSSGIAVSIRARTVLPPIPPMIPAVIQPVPPPTPPRPELTAAIDLYTFGRSGDRVQLAELTTTRRLIRMHGVVEESSIIQRTIVPEIGVAPEITATAGVRFWSLSIRRGNEEIAHITSENPGTGLDLELAVGDSMPAPLRAELLVEDSTGAVAGAQDILPFVRIGHGTPPINADEYDSVEEVWIVPADDWTATTNGRASGSTERMIGEAAELAQKHASPIYAAICGDGSGSADIPGRDLEALRRMLAQQGWNGTVVPKIPTDDVACSDIGRGLIIRVVHRSDEGNE